MPILISKVVFGTWRAVEKEYFNELLANELSQLHADIVDIHLKVALTHLSHASISNDPDRFITLMISSLEMSLSSYARIKPKKVYIERKEISEDSSIAHKTLEHSLECLGLLVVGHAHLGNTDKAQYYAHKLMQAGEHLYREVEAGTYSLPEGEMRIIRRNLVNIFKISKQTQFKLVDKIKE